MATYDELLQELINSQALNGGTKPPELVLQELAALQEPWNPVNVQPQEAPQGAQDYSWNGSMQPQPTKESGYFIKEFPQEAWAGQSAPVSDLTPQQERAQRLQKEWGSLGYVFEVDPKTGQTTITNTAKTRAAAGVVQDSSTMTAPTQLAGNFRAQMQAVYAEQDPVKRSALMADMQTSVAAFQAQLWQDTLKQQEAKLNVPQLSATLAENEAADKSDPRWKEFQSDSKITANVRQQLLRARAQADNEAKAALQGNVTLAALDAQMKAAQNVFQRAETLQNQRETARINREAAQADRQETFAYQKVLQRQLEDQALLDETSPEALARMAVIDPSFVGKPAADVARYLNKGITDTKLKTALLAPSEALPELAIMADNSSAERVLIAKEAEATGRTPDEVRANINLIKGAMTNPKTLEKYMKLTYPDAAQRSAVQTELTKANMGGTKTEQEAALGRKWEIVRAGLSYEAGNTFLGDVNTWNLPDPAVQAAITKAKETSGTANAEEVLAAFIGDSVGPDRQVKINQFLTMMDVAMKPKATSLLAPINPAVLKQQLVAAVNLRQVSSQFNVNSMIANTFKSALFPMPPAAITAPVAKFFGGNSNGQ